MKIYLIRLFVLLITLAGNSLHAYESPIQLEHRRSVEQTFLTYPEWFLVHSPAEYANYVAVRPAHEFPFMGHIGQLWSGYKNVIKEQVRARHPANVHYHIMICVIASSTTVEYGLRWMYENTFGRISWAISNGKLTTEDHYGAKVAKEYVDFIRKEPWYLFDFIGKLKALWTDTPIAESNLIRKWERRYALTTEYLVKALYGQLIKLATQTAYDAPEMTTHVLADHLPAVIPQNTQVLQSLSDGRAILVLPRYEAFTQAAIELANAGVQIMDIAGNNSVILVTVWQNSSNHINIQNYRVLFEQPLLTLPNKKRLALIIPVVDLSSFLRSARDSKLEIEHIYDY